LTDPEGIESFSPGLRGHELPWVRRKETTNLKGVESNPQSGHRDVVPQSLAKILVYAVFYTKDRHADTKLNWTHGMFGIDTTPSE
jgi:hypothetical protein